MTLTYAWAVGLGAPVSPAAMTLEVVVKAARELTDERAGRTALTIDWRSMFAWMVVKKEK